MHVCIYIHISCIWYVSCKPQEMQCCAGKTIFTILLIIVKDDLVTLKNVLLQKHNLKFYKNKHQ